MHFIRTGATSFAFYICTAPNKAGLVKARILPVRFFISQLVALLYLLYLSPFSACFSNIAQCLVIPCACHTLLLSLSQNHRIIWAGRHLQWSSSPTPCNELGHLQLYQSPIQPGLVSVTSFGLSVPRSQFPSLFSPSHLSLPPLEVIDLPELWWLPQGAAWCMVVVFNSSALVHTDN